MIKLFTTRELIFIALMAALMFVLNFSLGAGIVAATGIPASSGLVDSVTSLLVMGFTLLVVRKFGTVSLFALVYGIIALPTHMAGGPPGFVPKVLIFAATGLCFDAIVYFWNYRKTGFVVALPVMSALGLGLYLLVYAMFGMPEYDKMLKAVTYLVPVVIVEGYLGLWLAFSLYKRMKDKQIIRRIQK